MRTVHVGFPKTGTTFLQERVFPLLADQIFYAGKQASAAFFRPLMNNDDTIYDAGPLVADLDTRCPRGQPALFSYEALTGLHHHCAFVNRSTIARRLRELGFDRVLITIRNQPDALESAYKQYIKSGGTLHLHDYLSFDDSRPRVFYPEYFDYYPIYRLYAGLYGPENVLLLQYEHLNEPTFLSQMFAFLGLASTRSPQGGRVNRSLSSRKTRVMRVVNRFIALRSATNACHRLLAALPIGNDDSSMLDAGLRARIAAFFREPNMRLRAEAAIQLAPQYP